jgi:iron complex transport system permease protein
MVRTGLLVAAVATVLCMAILLGDHPISLRDLISAVAGRPMDDTTAQILLDVRLPRVVLAFLIGSALGITGTIMQTVLRNPLAEPGLIGVNAGAALAAVIIIVQFEVPPTHILSSFAFVGALVLSLAIYALSWKSGSSSMRIILIGVGLSALAGAGCNFIVAFGNPAAVQRAMFWLAGSVYGSTWEKCQTLALWLVVGFSCSLALARELDLLALGGETASARGQRVELVRALLFIICAVLAGAAVAAAGPIAFVGLVAPHAARVLVGYSHRQTMTIAAAAGGVLVVAADLAGRTLFQPAQIPVGLVIAMIGAPLFGLVMWRRLHV